MFWVLAIVAAISWLVFRQVDDWGRDLTTNVAITSEASELLQPLRLNIPTAETLRRLRSVVGELPRWTWQSEKSGEDGVAQVMLTRSTALWRFTDDITVWIDPLDEGRATRVRAKSQSRIGRGDLGQNPRNLIELLQAMQRYTDAKGVRQ